MFLYVFRHADAVSDAATDDERPLSEKGMTQVKRVAKFCASNELLPAVILTSPLRRAQETAILFSVETRVKRILSVEFLRSGMTPEKAIRELAGYQEFASVMIVGHEPDFSALVASLLGVQDREQIHLRKASLTAIDLPDVKEARGILEFSIPVKLMSR
jgi:phosphohistidine phosphatase